jgi:hypothetical protein
MNRLAWWMRIVGGFYLVMGIFNTPPIIEARLLTQYPSLGVPTDSAAARALIDTWFMFGLEVIVIGASLVYLSRDPLRHIALIWVVIAMEALRGIVFDLYLIAQGYENVVVYVAWIIVHLVIIVTGVHSIRYSRADESRVEAASVATRGAL